MGPNWLIAWFPNVRSSNVMSGYPVSVWVLRGGSWRQRSLLYPKGWSQDGGRADDRTNTLVRGWLRVGGPLCDICSAARIGSSGELLTESELWLGFWLWLVHISQKGLLLKKACFKNQKQKRPTTSCPAGLPSPCLCGGDALNNLSMEPPLHSTGTLPSPWTTKQTF